MSTPRRFALPQRLTMAEAAGVATQLQAAATEAGPWQVDASALQQFDSSALSVLLQARRLGAAQVLGMPPKLTALAELYGVAEVVTGAV